MANNKLAQLQKYQRKVAALEKALGKERRKLLALPGRLGFKSVNGLIAALRSAVEGSTTAGSAGKPAGKRKRAKITPATKEAVKKLVGQGKTGNVIAKSLGISLPSVQNIKRELGLVRKSS